MPGRWTLTTLRRRVGMVFQKANPFPMSIYDNITYGPKLHGMQNKAELDELVEKLPAGRGPLGRGERPPEKERPGPFRRPAAAPVHRPRAGRQAGSAADGRAHQRPGPRLHHEGGRADERAERRTTPWSSSPTTCSRRPASATAPRSSCWASWWSAGPTAQIFSTPQDKRTEDYISGRFG